jgi:transposase
MVMIGTDSHKRTHTAVALDEVGRRLAEKTVPATSDGHLALVSWARQWPQVSFAAEDCRNMTRRLERDLLAAGYRLVRVPTRLMAQARAQARQPGKSDPIDAEAVALAALRHHDRLPIAELDGPTRQVKLLVDHRRDLVGERTRVVNGCAGTCTNSTPHCGFPPAGCAATASSTALASTWPRSLA